VRRLERRLREPGSNICSTHECRSPAECADTISWRCHNCSCGMRAVVVTPYRTRIGTSNRRSQKYFMLLISSITLLAERTSFSRISSSTDVIFQMAKATAHCEWITFCGQTKHISLVRVYPMSTTVTSGYSIIVRLQSASASAFVLKSSEHCLGLAECQTIFRFP
jgi:hypothetical protein